MKLPDVNTGGAWWILVSTVALKLLLDACDVLVAVGVQQGSPNKSV